MWFKNIHVFRFSKPFDLTPESMSEQLAVDHFVPCGSQDLVRKGWVPPMGNLGEDFVHSADGYTMLCLKRQEKIVPAMAVNEQLADKVVQIEAAEGRKVGRKERVKLKEEIIFTMLPRAFTRSSLVHAYIDSKQGLLIINTSSTTRAEELCTELRGSLGSLPVIPLVAGTAKTIPPFETMTRWLKNRIEPNGFEFGHECSLRDTLEEKAVIQCKFQNLCSEQINQHLQEGMQVTRLGLISQNGIECIVDENINIKRLVFGDVIQERARETDGVDAAAQFDIDFSLMTLELKNLIASLMREFSVPMTKE